MHMAEIIALETIEETAGVHYGNADQLGCMISLVSTMLDCLILSGVGLLSLSEFSAIRDLLD